MEPFAAREAGSGSSLIASVRLRKGVAPGSRTMWL